MMRVKQPTCPAAATSVIFMAYWARSFSGWLLFAVISELYHKHQIPVKSDQNKAAAAVLEISNHGPNKMPIKIMPIDRTARART